MKMPCLSDKRRERPRLCGGVALGLSPHPAISAWVTGWVTELHGAVALICNRKGPGHSPHGGHSPPPSFSGRGLQTKQRRWGPAFGAPLDSGTCPPNTPSRREDTAQSVFSQAWQRKEGFAAERETSVGPGGDPRGQVCQTSI